jgi:hypothetical protein
VDASGGDVEEYGKSVGEPHLGRTYVKSDPAEFQIQDYRDTSQELRPLKIMLTRGIRQKQPKNETFTDVQGSAVVTRVRRWVPKPCISLTQPEELPIFAHRHQHLFA